ncbi:hypothetical protein EHQ53_04855 [Leptospira langatensis]|uniref:Galactose oxidase n=1 Tax=Leptospira langatensis TaxID=2484983 RepID=A0A5F1ZWI3_9LEPT|nr:kelch repeat-containing protein [Leptospira langatensis]TGK00146.1 hypothetical protein EHO57_12715 [Leptospira langatensis]TGL42781.1 hypothetical protein EHQ53_04855 [Leptospira langatensis]
MRPEYFIFIIFFLGSIRCSDPGLSSILGEEASKVGVAYIAKLGPNSATLSWNCSEPAKGGVYSEAGMVSDPSSQKNHWIELKYLQPNTEYHAILTCGSQSIAQGKSIRFKTWISNDPPKTRGIWIVGGIGSTALPIAEIDLFDPVTGTWYPSITSVPTPRVYASVLSHKSKIYVIGGMELVSGVYNMSSKVEVYDPYSGIWENKAGLPFGSQGAVYGSVGDEIYILSGSNSSDMTNGPVFNTILKFYPEIGASGQWISYSSSSSIFSRVDMSGCAVDGTIFHSGGRTYNTGSANSSTDGFVPSANTTTSFSEPSLVESKHGGAGLCINPGSQDPYPGDGVWFAVIGGSTGSGNVFQPATSILPTNKTEFYQLGSGVFSAGPTLPSSLYYPAAQASYETRNIFVFGGASAINVPEDSVYFLDSGNPILSSWSLHPKPMPRRRYAHKAIRIDR